MGLIREGRRMTLYQKMLVFYAVMGCICAIISWFLTKEPFDSPAGRAVDRRHLAV
jgi:Na+/melibiose symporter-like transporter